MKRVLVLVVLVLTAAEIKAQVLTLEEAVNIALKNSLDIQIAKNNEQASQISNHISVAGGLPVISGTLSDNQSLTNLNQKLNSGTVIKRPNNVNNAVNAGISGSYLLFNGFRVYASKNRLAALERQSTQVINTQIQNIISDVMVKYYDIIRQESYMKTIQQSIDVTLKRKEIVDARRSVGLANNADTYQAQIDLNASRQELQSQHLVLLQAKADLMNLLTQRPDSSFAVHDTIIVDSALNFETVKESLKRNPQLLSAEQQIRINEWIVKEVAAQRYPSVSLNGGFNFSHSQSSAGNVILNQNYGPFVGVSVAVPIFNGGLSKRQQQVAEIDTKNAISSHTIISNSLETSAVKSWQAYQNNLQQLKTERENNKLANDLLQLTLQRYQLSQATIIEVREAQRSFVEAGYRLINLAYAAKTAEIELKRLSSQLGI
ncbi:TolC family protein [Segetibacter koreensis]|uniref:TolC family protein n=1 Tax=Segetibacter koreensis TaxID=398037 RepID=UPI00037F2C06|nr:TolC family protein [Segetibacter koreensis]